VDVNIRRAKHADMATIWKATLQTVWDDLPDDERARVNRDKWEKDLRRRIAPYVEGGRTEGYVAEDPDGAVVGYLLLGEGGGFLTSEAHGFIFDVWVTADRRGKGVGTYLVEWASEWAKKRGFHKIKLEVSETNARARHIYEKLGFRSERRYMGRSLE
jgi:ribosomal protein S18 acetylase RimI-like enzyme